MLKSKNDKYVDFLKEIELPENILFAKTTLCEREIYKNVIFDGKSVYIMWKLIISGPAWVLSLVGVDGKQDDMIAQGIEHNLAKKAFVA